MPIIKAFKGIYFNYNKVKLSNVVTPPYDVISSEQQEEFYNKSEYNIIRLILGKTFPDDTQNNNRYTRAAKFLDKWLNDGIFLKDETEAIYYLEEKFLVNNEFKTRKGFIALTKLEDFNKGNILPHEKTMKGPKADRLNLMKACKTNFSQIFSVYSDDKSLTLKTFKDFISKNNEKPFISLEYENIIYSLWKVNNKGIIYKISSLMKDKKIFIADGHHRYETALNYRDYMRNITGKFTGEEPFDYVMMYFSPIENNDLLILPTHRGIKNVEFNSEGLLKNLSNYFDIEKFELNNLEILLKKLEQNKNDFTCFGAYFGGKEVYFLKFFKELKENLNEYEQLDVEILQKFIFEKILNITEEDLEQKTKVEYIKDIIFGINKVKSGDLKAIFIMNPTKIEQVKKIALSGGKMPQKSTYFYPKLLTGLLIYKIE